MTLNELRESLARIGVRPDAYCLTGGLPNDAYTLERVGGAWRVYYSERGDRTDLREFANESNACDDLLERLLRDPSTR